MNALDRQRPKAEEPSLAELAAQRRNRNRREQRGDVSARSKRGPPDPSTPDEDKDTLPPLEALRIAPLWEAAGLAGVSERTLRRRFREHIIQISPRRQGMRVRDALFLKQPAAKAAETA
jgi:hypothetical protein